MNKQKVLSKLIKHTNLSMNEFVNQVNMNLKARSTISEIAYVLAKLPDDKRSVNDVVKVLMPAPVRIASAESTNTIYPATKASSSSPVKHDTTVSSPSSSSTGILDANSSNATPQRIYQEQVSGSMMSVPLSTSKSISALPKLGSSAVDRKKNWEAIEKFLRRKGVVRLYHFTDFSNLPSIIREKGLYSWRYCENHSIVVNHPGGDELSRSLDSRYSLEDYVRASFNPTPPMFHIAKNSGRIPDPVILAINLEVAYWDKTIFSNINATDNHALFGGELSDLQNIKFEFAMQTEFISNPEERKYQQAEVMVRTHIPLKHILFPKSVSSRLRGN